MTAKRHKTQTVSLLEDITIPAGTEAVIEPPHHTHYATKYVSVLIAHGKDRTSKWLMPLDEAVSFGLVSEPERKQTP